MANKTSKLTIVIAGKDQGAQKALKETQTGVQGLGGAASALGSKMAGAFSVGAIAAFGKKAIADASAYAGEVLKIQRISGASAKDSSFLAFAAKNAGVEATKAATSYQILAKNIENGKVAAAGIATKDANGNLLEFDQIIRNVADKMASLPPGVERTALALKVFGRGGADMVKILGKGSEALEAQKRKMESLGLEFNDTNLANYKKFAQQQRDIKGALLGVEVGIANGVLPKLNQLSSAMGHVPLGPFGNIAKNVEYVSGALFDAISVVGPFVSVWNDLNDAYHEFSGVEAPLTKTALDAVAKATKDAGIEAEGAAPKIGKLEKAYIASTNAQKMAALAEKSYANKTALKGAIEDVASAQDELNKAREAEKGNSDEYRSAVQAERDDLQQLADDQAAVTQAVVDAGEAQKELTEARADAADKVRSLRDEVVKANMAERDSVLALHEAQAEARRVLADPKATKLDKERAQVELLDAQDKATLATKDKAQAEREAATATIEGDQGVIAAHKRVEDAQRAIGAAEKKVADDRAALVADGLAKTKILNDAAVTRKDAEKRVADALFSQAEAFRQIQADSKGPIAGLQAFADALGSIEDASPEVRMLLAQIQAVIAQATGKGVGATGRLGVGTSASGNLGGSLSAIDGAIAPGLGTGGLQSGPVDLPPKKGKARNFNNPGATNITVHIAGTSRQHGRMIGAAVGSTIDKHTRRRRG